MRDKDKKERSKKKTPMFIECVNYVNILMHLTVLMGTLSHCLLDKSHKEKITLRTQPNMFNCCLVACEKEREKNRI